MEAIGSGVWNLVSMALDIEQSHGLGFAGLYGESVSTGYAITFDDMELSER